MRAHPSGRTRGLHRDAAATVLRDRAMEVAGVQSARVRMRRRKARVRALSHFRELDDVRTDLDGALDDAVAGARAGPAARRVAAGRAAGTKGVRAVLRTVDRVLLGLVGLILLALGGSVLAIGFGAPAPSWWLHDGPHDVLLR